MTVAAHDYARHTIYHSPQTPGYTCWTGIWKMADGSVMVGFTQATGPLAGWRPRAPQSVLRRMPTATQEIAGYDMTGLVQENVYLRSTDRGETWTKVAADPFSSCMNGCCGGGAVALADGTILRVVWGQALPFYDVPATGFLQRSTDAAQTWGPPEFLSPPPSPSGRGAGGEATTLQTWPTRLRLLRDGRLLCTGAANAFDPDWTWMAVLPRIRACLWVSADGTGRSWSEPLYVAPEGVNYAGEEWDTAELDNGDLLAVFRTATYDAAGQTLSQERRQSLLTRDGATWRPGPITPAPFPHSGHPELLRTPEGVVLHIASSAISWTADRGATWQNLDVPGSAYYPHAVQLDDGTVLVVSHIGSDDPYGKTDQSVVLDRFRLTVQP